MFFDLIKLTKKELIVLMNPEEFSRIIDVLKINHIRYWTRIENNTAQSSDRRNHGIGYHPTNPKMFYYIYVSNKDYEKACHLIH